MTEEEKIFAGMLFCPGDESLRALKLRAHNLSQDYNRCYEEETAKREAILGQLLGRMGQGSFLQGPIQFHYGCHTFIGENFFGNFNLTIQDDAKVTIGDNCSFGPNVTIVTPVHPLLPLERRHLLTAQGEQKHMCYAKPVRIGNDCWLGANVVICPGVTVGDGCVIGAGSVVTRDIPGGCVAAGNPCRVLREITEGDSMANFPELLGENRVK